jgi:hypothetical protein
MSDSNKYTDRRSIGEGEGVKKELSTEASENHGKVLATARPGESEV